MRVLAVILVIGALIFYGVPGLRRGLGNRAVRRHQGFGGGMYSQINSVTGRMRPPKLSSSFWFIMAACVLLLWALLGHKS